MESSEVANSLLDLGRKLVEELGGENSRDTLGRWMAHYVADLIIKAASATGDKKIEIERECCATILLLWQHRSVLPNGSRPYENLEAVLRAVESLDPKRNGVRYYPFARPPLGENAESTEQKTLLELVEGLDYSAKFLISYFLSEAASASLDQSKEWVKKALELDVNSVPEVTINFLWEIEDLTNEQNLNEIKRKQLNETIQRLRAFTRTADSMAEILEKRLQNLSTS